MTPKQFNTKLNRLIKNDLPKVKFNRKKWLAALDEVAGMWAHKPYDPNELSRVREIIWGKD